MHLLTARLLVVEDDDATRKMVEDVLTSAGYDVVSASHGAEALRLLNRDVPDVIVLDLMLPWINGIEVLSTIRQQPQLSRVPVLVITGTVTSTFDLRAFHPLSVMRKPLEPDALVSAVEELLSEKPKAE